MNEIDNFDTAQLVTLWHDHNWTAVTAIVIGLATRLVKSDIRIFPNIPARYRIWFVLALGVASAVLERMVRGVSWSEAALEVGAAVFFAVMGHETIIASIRAGREVEIPGITIPGARPNPVAPPTIPPATSPPVVPPDPPAST